MAPRTQTYANLTGVSVGWCLWERLSPGLEQELQSADCAVIPDQSKHLSMPPQQKRNRFGFRSIWARSSVFSLNLLSFHYGTLKNPLFIHFNLFHFCRIDHCIFTALPLQLHLLFLSSSCDELVRSKELNSLAEAACSPTTLTTCAAYMFRVASLTCGEQQRSGLS